MLVTITEFCSIFTDKDGNDLPMGGTVVTGQQRSADGSFAALGSATQFVRIATDTVITSDITGHTTLHTAGAEFFPVEAGQIIAIAAV